MSQIQLVKDLVSHRPITTALALALSIPFLLSATRRALRTRRTQVVAKNAERVLIVGASSGIGRALAHDYAARGAFVCVVARRAELVAKVAQECRDIQDKQFLNGRGDKKILEVAGDCASTPDMVRVRTLLQEEWGGFDTLILTAGVTALRPLYEVAGLTRDGEHLSPPQATPENIQHTADVAQSAINANYIGPVIIAVTFFPLLEQTSKSPSVLLLSSWGAVIAAPTRSLYCSTKAASFMLYQALAVEHSKIAFTAHLPSTVQGNFRASAVDGGPVRTDDQDSALRLDQVSRSCIDAVDSGARTVFMPAVGKLFMFVQWIWHKPVERGLRRKYNFHR